MAYEAKSLGFECPSLNVNAWEEKLKDLGGNPVEYPAKPAGEEPSKATKEATNAGGDTEKVPEDDAGAGAGEDAAVEEGAAP
ncbi:hypothetical protein Hanom_Chr10g00910631 [Helianthus anomalus]